MCAGIAAGAQSPLAGKRVVVLGAGGAGRALAFGAIERGAHVIVANRYQSIPPLHTNLAHCAHVAKGKVCSA